MARPRNAATLQAPSPVNDGQARVQVACVGLVNAVDRFDPARGLAFTSFAVPTILGELKRYFRDHGWSVHVPRGTQEMALKVEQVRHRLEVESGRSPTVDELVRQVTFGLCSRSTWNGVSTTSSTRWKQRLRITHHRSTRRRATTTTTTE